MAISDVVYPLPLRVHFFVGSLQFKSKLGDVQLQARVLLVKPFKLTLHLLKNRKEKKIKLAHFFLKHHATETVPIGCKVCFLCNYNCKISFRRHDNPGCSNMTTQSAAMICTHARARKATLF